MKTTRVALSTMLAAAVLTLGSSAPANAQVWDPGWGTYAGRSEAYENGYRRGYENGAADARSRRPFDFRREREYRDADRGYDRRYGSRDDYRRVFRNGFEAGYGDGYRRAPANWGVGYGRYSPSSWWQFSRVAFNYGFNDGYERGMKAARDRKRFDPYREGWYRDGDRHYDSDYGPRDQYRPAYRDGFVRGYEQGYGRDPYRR